MPTEYNSEFCRVFLTDGAVCICWKKFCCGADYRAPTLFALELLRAHPRTNLLIDARDGFEDDPADVVWAFAELLPAMAQTDCETVTFLMHELSAIEDEMDLWGREFSKYFRLIRKTAD